MTKVHAFFGLVLIETQFPILSQSRRLPLLQVVSNKPLQIKERSLFFMFLFSLGAVPEESVLDLPQVRLERYFPDSHMEPVLFLVNKMAVGKHFRNGQIPSHDHMDHLFPDNFARHIPVWH